jgi:DNA-binding phage protein
MTVKLAPFDAAKYLLDEEAIVAFLQDAERSGNQEVIQEARRIAARARERLLLDKWSARSTC